MVHCGKLEPFLSFSSPFFLLPFFFLILVLTTLVSYLVLPGFFWIPLCLCVGSAGTGWHEMTICDSLLIVPRDLFLLSVQRAGLVVWVPVVLFILPLHVTSFFFTTCLLLFLLSLFSSCECCESSEFFIYFAFFGHGTHFLSLSPDLALDVPSLTFWPDLISLMFEVLAFFSIPITSSIYTPFFLLFFYPFTFLLFILSLYGLDAEVRIFGIGLGRTVAMNTELDRGRK